MLTGDPYYYFMTDKCPFCGKRYTSAGCDCHAPYKQEKLITNPHNGWTCPKCGSVYAPFVSECSRCNGPLKVTC